jgi:cytochrome b6-f complex iron-sulfur subunit
MPAMPPNVPDRKEVFARRDFLRVLGGLPLWLAGGAALVGLEKYLSFEVDPPPQTLFVVGRPGDYPIGSISPVPEAKAALYHDTRGFFALSMVCTHLGCTIKKTETGYDCPCHGSRFDLRGRVDNGPAASALAAVAVAQDSQGHLMLDTGQGVSRDWRFVPS